MKSTHDSPILVTGAAGDLGAIGRNLTAMLLAKGHKVRALVRREDERAFGLRQLGAEVVQGDLTDLTSMHRAIPGFLTNRIEHCPQTVFERADSRYHRIGHNTEAIEKLLVEI